MKNLAFILCILAAATLSFQCSSRQLDPVPSVPPEPTPIGVQTKLAPLAQRILPINAILAAQAEGPGRLLQRVPVVPFRDNGRFLGFQIVALFPGEEIRVDGLRAGDIISRVNGMRIDRPEQFMNLFAQIHQESSLEIEIIRDGQFKIVRFLIQ